MESLTRKRCLSRRDLSFFRIRGKRVPPQHGRDMLSKSNAW